MTFYIPSYKNLKKIKESRKNIGSLSQDKTQIEVEESLFLVVNKKLFNNYKRDYHKILKQDRISVKYETKRVLYCKNILSPYSTMVENSI